MFPGASVNWAISTTCRCCPAKRKALAYSLQRYCTRGRLFQHGSVHLANRNRVDRYTNAAAEQQGTKDKENSRPDPVPGHRG